MYKIYINETPLKLVTKSPHNTNLKDSSFLVLHYNGKKKFLLNVIDQLEKTSRFTEVWIYHTDLEELFNDFSSLYKIIEAAGGLVLNRQGNALIIFRRGKWDLPKGKIDKGESTKAAAIREVEEETGVAGLNIQTELPPTFHTYTLGNKRILKKTYWFQMFTQNTDLHLHSEEDIEDGRWVGESEIRSGNFDFYRSIEDVIHSSSAFHLNKD